MIIVPCYNLESMWSSKLATAIVLVSVVWSFCMLSWYWSWDMTEVNEAACSLVGWHVKSWLLTQVGLIGQRKRRLAWVGLDRQIATSQLILMGTGGAMVGRRGRAHLQGDIARCRCRTALPVITPTPLFFLYPHACSLRGSRRWAIDRVFASDINYEEMLFCFVQNILYL